MITQDVSALPTFNPHGGPIPTVPQDRNLTLLYTPVPKVIPPAWTHMKFMSHLPMRSSILASDTILIPIALNPFHISYQATNDCLSTWNFLLHLRTLLSIFSSVSIRELLSTTFPDVSYQIVNLAEVRCLGIPPLFFRKYDGVPEERMPTSSWWPEAEKWRHQCIGPASSRRASQNEKTR